MKNERQKFPAIASPFLQTCWIASMQVTSTRTNQRYHGLTTIKRSISEFSCVAYIETLLPTAIISTPGMNRSGRRKCLARAKSMFSLSFGADFTPSTCSNDDLYREKSILPLSELAYWFDSFLFERKMYVEICNHPLNLSSLVPHLHERCYEFSISCWIFCISWFQWFQIERSCEFDDNFLSGFFSDSWNWCKESILMAFDRSKDAFDTESEDSECSFPTDSIYTQKFLKYTLLALALESKEHFWHLSSMVIDGKGTSFSDQELAESLRW